MIKPAKLATIIALALSVSACSTFDLGSTGVDEIRAEKAAINAPVSWVFGDQTDGQIAAEWSSILSDPILDGLIDRALANNPSLRASAESVARSEAFLAQSKSNRLPSLSADFSPNFSTLLEDSDLFENYSGGLSASWEADLWGGIKAGVLASGFDLAGTQAAFETARQALIASVARSYISAIEADLQIDLSEQTLRAQEETLRIVKVRYELGAASRREVVLADSDVASAQDNLVVARAAKTDAIQALQITLGDYPSGELAIASDFPSFAETPGTGTPEAMLRRRPDVLAAEFDVLGAFQSTRAVKADTLPILNLSGGVDTSSGTVGDLLDPISIALSVGARLADTIFDGGFSEAQIDAASATQRESLANYGQTILDAYFDVESALNTVNILEERRIFVRRSADAARETVTLAEIQYKEGDIDLIDVLTFRQRSFQADQTEISLSRQVIDARIALYLALGGTGFNAEAFN